MGSEFGHRFTDRARRDVDEIVSGFVYDLRNPKAASRFVATLMDRLECLALYPKSGESVRNRYLPHGDVRKKPFDHYLLYYLAQMSERVILVLRVVDARRSQRAVFENLGA